MRLVSVLVLPMILASCSSDGNLRSNLDDPENPTGATETEPEPEPVFDAAVVLDDVHVAGLLEEPHAFSLLGAMVDPVLEQQIDAGTLLLGLHLRDVHDPAFRTDEGLSVAMYVLADADGDSTDNFDPAAPETFDLAPGALVDGEPVMRFTDAALVDGTIDASGLDTLPLGDSGIPLPLSDLAISGALTVADGAVQTLEDGRLTSVIELSLLALVPNPIVDSCAGGTLLDVLATGCGFFGIQPDVDVDGDGLERLFDDDDDGTIDRCVDGDGTEILGADCARDPAIADGYELILVIHGVRAELALP